MSLKFFKLHGLLTFCFPCFKSGPFFFFFFLVWIGDMITQFPVVSCVELEILCEIYKFKNIFLS